MKDQNPAVRGTNNKRVCLVDFRRRYKLSSLGEYLSKPPQILEDGSLHHYEGKAPTWI